MKKKNKNNIIDFKEAAEHILRKREMRECKDLCGTTVQFRNSRQRGRRRPRDWTKLQKEV